MTMLTMSGVADLLDIEPDNAQLLVTKGFIAPDADDCIPLASAICGYVRSLRDEAQRASASAATTRLQAARVRAIELRNGEADGVLLDLVEHQDIYTEALGNWKAALYGLPARTSRDLDVRRRIEAAIDEALHRLCDELEARAVAPEAEGDTPR
jgi:hypothetical protein